MTSRRPVVALTLALLALLLAFDLASSGVPNVYQQPAAIALGSGQASGGALCSSLPE